MTNFMVLATVPVVWAIGIVLIIAGVVYLTRGRMLLGGVLTVLGILMGGLNVLDTRVSGGAGEGVSGSITPRVKYPPPTGCAGRLPTRGSDIRNRPAVAVGSPTRGSDKPHDGGTRDQGAVHSQTRAVHSSREPFSVSCTVLSAASRTIAVVSASALGRGMRRSAS